MEALKEFFQSLQTEHLVELLRQMNLAELVQNPAFLGSMGIIAALCLFKRWYGFLGSVMGLTGFVWLISYTLQQGTDLQGGSNSTLLVFIGGGVVIIGLMIYLLFIKSD
ncbi:hypothetical protein C2E25_11220 [Geothermobacter hydrogeniphilus]|uniref:Uncharacterized protein n=1 Tax=Geothermobacter hydrogeniphilus TaxID=1969733 RepID=A0A1X0Y5J0_9BACT|nr:hypothetical protein [Geothermobacter hydrogeniphilus]ORJ60332.1 hypothetical protein B5V00_08770 [Geothermobacter hydrogeniphilus]PNU19667.1 hypothetical protein C2E25_11220 [Geothermobacter hydrogeniphilus]